MQSLESDIAYELEFMKCLKRRNLEQKFIYIDENAVTYYANQEADRHADITDLEYYEFIKSYLPSNQSILFVGMGCGDSSKETPVLEKLIADNINITYVAVDSSKKMMELSYQKLRDTKVPYILMQADITTNIFTQEISNLIDDYDFTVIALMGSTMGNMVQTEVVDSLYNISKKGNLILLDILKRSGDDSIDRVKLFKHYAKRLENPDKMSFYFHPLKKIGIPFENGQMEVHASTEDSVGVQKFRYQFRFKQPTEVKFRGQTIHFLPPESVKLLDIRSYYTPTLISFFEKHKLMLLKDFYKEDLGLFLFKRD